MPIERKQKMEAVRSDEIFKSFSSSKVALTASKSAQPEIDSTDIDPELESIITQSIKPVSIIDSIPENADPKKVSQQLISAISKEATSILSSPITSQSEYDTALSIRSQIKQSLSWFDSKLDEDIATKYKAHRNATANKKTLTKPFTDLDSKLDSHQKDWLRIDRARIAAEKAARDADLVSMAEILALEDAEGLLSSEDEGEVQRGLELVTQVSEGRAGELLGPLPEYAPGKDKPKGSRVAKRVKIVDVTIFRNSFVNIFLSESEEAREVLRKYLERKVTEIGFENTEKIAGVGSIIHEDVDSIQVRR